MHNSIASQAIILYKRVYEALLLMPSKSALRAVRGKKWVAKQVAELCRVIAQIGVPTGDGRIFATFGQMFEAYLSISDTLVGTLQRAKKKLLVTFEKEMLWQGRDDGVKIFMTGKAVKLYGPGTESRRPSVRLSSRSSMRCALASAMRLGHARESAFASRTDAARRAVTAAADAAWGNVSSSSGSDSSSGDEESWEEVEDEEGRVFNYTGAQIGPWAEVVNAEGYAFWFDAARGVSSWEKPALGGGRGGGGGGGGNSDSDSDSSEEESEESDSDDVARARARSLALEPALIPDLGPPPSFDANASAPREASSSSSSAGTSSYHANRRGTSLFSVADLEDSESEDDDGGAWNVWDQGVAAVLPQHALDDLSAWRSRALDR